MTTVSIQHIVLDEKGVAYPHLSLSQIHAALSYYHDHEAEIDAQIEAGRELPESIRSQLGKSSSKAELLERLNKKNAAAEDET